MPTGLKNASCLWRHLTHGISLADLGSIDYDEGTEREVQHEQ